MIAQGRAGNLKIGTCLQSGVERTDYRNPNYKTKLSLESKSKHIKGGSRERVCKKASLLTLLSPKVKQLWRPFGIDVGRNVPVENKEVFEKEVFGNAS